MKTLIEAGHFYECNGPSNVSLAGWQIGAQRAASSPDAGTAVFVDDYHGEQPFTEEGEVFLGPEAGRALVQEAEHVFYESGVAQRASGESLRLMDDPAVKVRKGVVSVAGIRLGKVNGEGSISSPTCTLLDYFLLCEKADLAADQVTVLPVGYERQQTGLITVIDNLSVPNLSGYTVVLYAPDGSGAQKEIAA